MNWRLLPAAERLRLIIRSSVHGSTPASTRSGFNFFNSLPVKTASAVQVSAPVRMSDLSARSPSKSWSAPMIIDFPAPVDLGAGRHRLFMSDEGSSDPDNVVITRNNPGVAGLDSMAEIWVTGLAPAGISYKAANPS